MARALPLSRDAQACSQAHRMTGRMRALQELQRRLNLTTGARGRLGRDENDSTNALEMCGRWRSELRVSSSRRPRHSPAPDRWTQRPQEAALARTRRENSGNFGESLG